MRIVVTALAVLLAVVPAYAQNGARTPAGPGAEVGQPRKMLDTPAITHDVPVVVRGTAEHFVMPSGNIGCVYIPAGGTDLYQPADGGPELACDRIEPIYLRAVLARRGKAKVLKGVADQGCCGRGQMLQYGETWHAGPFTCYSQRTGLTCERDDGHSFLLSRARVRAD